MTRERLPGDPPRKRDVAALRDHVRAVLEPAVPVLLEQGPPDRGIGSSKTFRSLARLDGAAPYAKGPRVHRALSCDGLDDVVRALQSRTVVERCELPGVSPDRAHQLLAGAVVAHEAMDLLGLEEVSISPWALREGVILRRLDWLAGA